MKKKRILAIWMLSLIISGVLGPVCQASATETKFLSAEQARAESLGFGVAPTDNQHITYAQFMAMLDKAVERANPEKLSTWQARMPKARASTLPVLRCEAAVLLYLAGETLGEAYVVRDDIANQYYEEMVEPFNPNHPSFDEGMNAGFETGSFYKIFDIDFDNANHTQYDGNIYEGAAYYFAFSRISPASGKPLLEIREGAPRLAEPITYTEAMLASLRLSEAILPQSSERIPTDADQQIVAAAEARKEAIRNSPTTVTVKGTKYYVANNGNDENDGLTEETPWATLNRVSEANLKPGDGVFFHRGDVWRFQLLVCQEGVTYSAYGKGPKPAIYGSPENGTGVDKWKLVEGTTNIWEYHRPMRNTGAIVFNNGESYALEALVVWDGSKYVTFTSIHTGLNVNGKRAFTPRDLPDMTFWNDIDYSLAEEYDILGDRNGLDFNDAPKMRNDLEGKLFLRCDTGNPGNIFDSIEFCIDPSDTAECAVDITAGGVIVDNLCVKYVAHAMTIGMTTTQQYNRNDFTKGALSVVQNCEVGWAAGATGTIITNHNDDGSESIYKICTGDGIHVEGDNNTIQNSYFYECYDGGINIELAPTWQTFSREQWAEREITWENLIVKGNVVENCNGALCLSSEDIAFSNHKFKNVVLEDNYALYSGYGHSGAESKLLRDAPWGSRNYFSFALHMETPNANEGILIRNNVFYLSANALINSGMPEQYYPVYEGNTYVQNNYGSLAQWTMPEGQFVTIYHAGQNAEDFIKHVVGDQTAVVLPLSMPVH